MLVEFDTLSGRATAGWRAELASHRAHRTPTLTNFDVMVATASRWLKAWAELSTSDQSWAVTEARNLYERLQVVLKNIATHKVANPELAISDPSVAASIERIIARAKKND